MADIQTYPFVRHLRGSPTGYILHLRAGKVAHNGTGLSFWFRPLSAVLSEIPVDDRELPLVIHARTADFQNVTVQATVAYRIIDPGIAAARLDFSIDPASGGWRGNPLAAIAALLTELAQQHTRDLLAALPLLEALNATTAVRDRVQHGLEHDPRLRDTGLAVVGVRVMAVRPEPEVERALQTPTRESVQQEADKATFERRAIAVERERAISENELQSQIELAIREEQLVSQRGQNERRRAQESAAADAIAAAAQADRERALAASRADATRLVGLADADAETAKLAAYQGLDTATLLALALRDLAGQLPAIGTLNLTPDLLTTALGKLTGGSGGTGATAAGG
jgi:regulator of protease activity HflC (stomatin/prohibitin superfamily)